MTIARKAGAVATQELIKETERTTQLEELEKTTKTLENMEVQIHRRDVEGNF